MDSERRLTRDDLRGWYLCDKYSEEQLDALFLGRAAVCVFMLLSAPISLGDRLFILMRSRILSEEKKGELATWFSENTLLPDSKWAKLSRDAAEGVQFCIPSWTAGDYNVEPRLASLQGNTRRLVFAAMWSLAAAKTVGLGKEFLKTVFSRIRREVL